MKKVSTKILVALIALLFIFSPMSLKGIFIFSQAEDVENISGYQEWNVNKIIDKNVVVEEGATLIINKGVEVNFVKQWTTFEIHGTLIVKGSLENPVNIKTDFANDAFSIITKPGSRVFINNANIIGGGMAAFQVRRMTNSAMASNYKAALQIDGGEVEVRGTTFSNSHMAAVVVLDNSGAKVRVNFSKFINNEFDVEAPSGADFRLNWWGAYDGPAGNCGIYNGEQYCAYEKIFGDFDFSEWRPTADFSIGASNVLFLPGIKASRLYMKDEEGDEDQLWPPNAAGDVTDLKLNDEGKSIRDNIYAKDVIDEIAFPWMGENIYKTFEAQLKDLDDRNIILDYSLFAYDWRQNVEDIVQNGTLRENNDLKRAVDEVIRLQENSFSRKVTIVAHSNGGLVAKALMQELEKIGKADSIDNIILVSSPQMGTPKSILTMLYGYDEGLLVPGIMNDADARELVEDMPGAYGLLPSEKYFNSSHDPIMKFLAENYADYDQYKEAYGTDINSYQEFKNFLLARDDGRIKPAKNEIGKENILNEKLLEEAALMHQRLDAWIPPFNVNLIQIGGWGLDTISSVEYKEKENVQCYATAGSKIPSCSGEGDYEGFYEPNFTVDGDDVVVTPSSLMLDKKYNAERYWMDLQKFNDNNIPDRKHAGILEVDSIDDMLSNLIMNHEVPSVLPKYISKERPLDYAGAKPRIRMSLYSPLDIHLYDRDGRHTGLIEVTLANDEKKTIIEKNIPNSYYEVFGDHKYVGFSAGEDVSIVLKGYAMGNYTVEMDEVTLSQGGEKNTLEAIFESLPTTENSTITLNVPETGLKDISLMKADMDSDGEVEYEKEAVLRVPVADGSAPEAKLIFNEKTQSLDIIGLSESGQKVDVVLANQPKIKKSNKKAQKINAWFSAWCEKDPEKNLKNWVATLTSESGRTTILVFKKLKEKDGKIFLNLKSIAYDGEENPIGKARLQYKWQINKKGVYAQLAAHFGTEESVFESHYRPKKDETWIMEKPRELKDDSADDESDTRPVKTKLPGMVIPSIVTEKGQVRVNY